MKKEDLDREFQYIHGRITELFYQQKAMSLEEFNRLHGGCWLYHEKALMGHGHQEDFKTDLNNPGSPMRTEQIEQQLDGLKIKETEWLKHGCSNPEKFLPKKD